MKTADKAWLALAGAVLAYESLAPTEELLSMGVDRYLLSHPWLTRLAVGITAAHLLNALPGRLDPFHGFGLIVLRAKGRSVPC